jgi:hypothetical protein
MDRKTLAAVIAELTGALRPANGSTETELERGRALLAQGLHSGQTADEFRGAASIGVNPAADKQAQQFLYLFGKKPATSKRVFARTVPSATNFHRSTPEWARGIAIADSTGPFLTPLGNPIWIDAFDVIQNTSLTRDSATLIGLFPVDSTLSTSRNIVLGEGSVWLPCQLLDRSSPNDSYTGFRIKSGTLTLSEDASTVSPGTLDISLLATATFTAVLDPPPPPPAGGPPDPGADAAAAVIVLPATLSIEFDLAGARLTALADSQANAYGQTVMLRWAGAEPLFEATTNELVTLLNFSPNRFQVSAAESRLLTPSGAGPIQAASWALPIAITIPGNLGAAAGAGALILAVGQGIAERWAGLPDPAPLNETLLHLAPGQIAILANGSGLRISETFSLWDKSAIDFAPSRPFGSFYLSQPGLEWVEVSGVATAHLDRPVRADGSRFLLKIPQSTLVLSQSTQGFGIFLGTALNTEPSARAPIVLENGLLQVDRPVAMSLFGDLDPVNLNSVRLGQTGLEFPAYGVFPTLSDPYASSLAAKNFSFPDQLDGGILITNVSWQTPDTPLMVLDLSLPGAVGMIRGQRSTIAVPDAVNPQILLLDLSSNADFFGVLFFPFESPGVVKIDQMALALPGSDLTVFTVPQVSWEPMKSEPPAAGLRADNDGFRSEFQVETVNLVRLEPAAAVRFLESEVGAGTNFRAGFTLPFGLVAKVQAGQYLQSGGTFRLTQPAFLNYSGGLQITLGAPHPELEDASLPGTCHAIDPYGIAVLGIDVATIFNDEFLMGNIQTVSNQPPPPARVPVKRIDFSGYGESLFSDWRDSKIEAGVIKAQFDVVVGRTAFEVVKVQSNLVPWAARVVRTITIERQGAGWINRIDSEWQAASTGVFNFPAHEKADYVGHVHTGAVLGVVNIRNIREVAGGLISAGGIEYQEVIFDADVLINNSFHVTNGGHVDGGRQLVPSKDVGGYVQLTPGDGPLRRSLAELLKKTGPVGGPVACIGNVGGPTGPQLTAVSMDVSINKTGPDAELVATLRGSLALPKEGAWTMAKKVGSDVPAALDPKFHLPLVQNEILEPGKWHFVEPADIAQIGSPNIAYGLVQATGTQKMFFARPSVDQAAPAAFNLPQPPHLADIGALLNATGLFPDLGAALPFTTTPPLGVAGGDLSFHPAPFALTGQAPKTLVDFGAVKVMLDYSDGGKIDPDTHDRGVRIPTSVDVHITPGADPSWSISLEPVSLILVTPFGDQNDPILRVVGGAKADSKTAPTLTSLDVQYGGALEFVQTVFSKLAEIANSLPGAPFARLAVSFSQGKLTIKDTFALPELPLGFGYVTDVALILGAEIELSPQSLDFTAGIGSEEKPFHWLVNPLSGTGVVQVGVRNGDLTILIEAGLGVGLAIDLAIASGSASVVIALQVNNEVSPFQIKAILTGQASVDVLDGLASASITLSAILGLTPDKLPIPDAITLYAGVMVGIHLSVCWLVSVDFDGAWGFSETFHKPSVVPF